MLLDAGPFIEFLESQDEEYLATPEERTRFRGVLKNPPQGTVELYVADHWFTKFDRADLFSIYYGE